MQTEGLNWLAYLLYLEGALTRRQYRGVVEAIDEMVGQPISEAPRPWTTGEWDE